MGLVSFSTEVHQISPSEDDFSQEIFYEYGDLFKGELGMVPLMYSVRLDLEGGWPAKQCSLPAVVQPFFPYRDELLIDEGIIMKSLRAVMPCTLQNMYMEILHRWHPGAEMTKRRAKHIVFWPGMTENIDDKLKGVCWPFKYCRSGPVQETPGQCVYSFLQTGGKRVDISPHSRMSGMSDLQEAEMAKEAKSDLLSAWCESDFAKAGFQSLEEFNIRFSRYINRTRTFDQSSTSLGKQLESLRQVRELSGLEDVFTDQIKQNQQRIWDLHNELNHLEQELKDAQRTLDEYRTNYRTECEHHEKLQDSVANLIKDTNEALIKNLDLQVRTQFLQEDIDSTKERNMKNLAEIQSYMTVLKQVHQPTSYDSPPTLSHGGAMQEQTSSTVEGHYLDQMQSYNEQIEDLRRKTEEAETSFEKCANECRQVVMYQQSLENELERYKHFITDEDYQLQSTISEVQTSPLDTSSQCEHAQDPTEGKDLSTTSTMPFSRKVVIGKDALSSDATEEVDVVEQYSLINVHNENVTVGEDREGVWDVGLDDVPDGAQISRVFDALCNMIREKMKKQRRPQVPVAEFYTKGHHVLVTGEASYADPFFCTSVPARSQVIVTFEDGRSPGPMDSHPQPSPPEPLKHDTNGNGENGFDSSEEKGEDQHEDKRQDDRKPDANREPKESPPSSSVPHSASEPSVPEPSHVADNKPVPFSGPSQPYSDPSAPIDSGSQFTAYHKEQKEGEEHSRGIASMQPLPLDEKLLKEPQYKYYEKIEMIEAVETFSDNKLQGYEETSTVVETTVEKTKQEMKAKKF
ncbi:filensin [Narcine bancroftii]|uniref:filensin n=1 Tax=Narcine bancroftii TaxID=1343680 RepID=UPI003831AB30